jgi:tripartite-type tricarboxylate transporter receptor subunit TctC
MAESGLAGYEVYGWYGFAAPARTPRPIIERLHAEVVKIAQNPKMKARLASQGLELVGSSPEEFDTFIRAEITKWSAVLKAAGLKPE